MTKINGKDWCLQHEEEYKKELDQGCYKNMHDGIDAVKRNAKKRNCTIEKYFKKQVEYGGDSITPHLAERLLANGEKK